MQAVLLYVDPTRIKAIRLVKLRRTIEALPCRLCGCRPVSHRADRNTVFIG